MHSGSKFSPISDDHTRVGADRAFRFGGHPPYAPCWADLAAAGAAFGIDRFHSLREPRRPCEALHDLACEFPCAGLTVQATIILSPAAHLPGAGGCLQGLAEGNDRPFLDGADAPPNGWFDGPALGADPVLSEQAERDPDRLLRGGAAPFYSCCDADHRRLSSHEREIAVLRALYGMVIGRITSKNTLAFPGV